MKVGFKSKVTGGFSFSPLRGSLIGKKRKASGTRVEVKVLGKVLVQVLVCLVQIIIRLDSHSEFQMFKLFFGRHVGVPLRYTNMAASYWAL